MNIVFITGRLSGGGAERVISLISSEFAKHSHNVSVVSLLSDNDTYEISNKVKIFQYCGKHKTSIFRFLAKRSLIRRVVKSEQADIVVSFMTGAILLSIMSLSRLSVPLISCERNDPSRHPSSKLNRILRKILYRFSDGFVFQSEDAKNFFSKEIQSRSTVIPNPVNPNLPNRYSGIRKKKIVSIGRLENAKNYEMSIRAFKCFYVNHSDYIYEIYGEGSMKEGLTRLIRSLNLSNAVFLKGFTNNLYNAINDAKMYVLTSYYEGMPNALIEAMSLGLPSISTIHPFGGAKEIIVDGVNGMLVSQNNVSELAKAMHKIAIDDFFAEKLSQAGIDLKQRLSMEIIYSSWEDYLKSHIIKL